jgi:hypothetical protein
MNSTNSSRTESTSLLRPLILVIMGIGTLGILGELLLLEHYKFDSQWIAVMLTLLTGVCTVILGFNPNARVMRVVQLALLLVVLGSAFGVLEHVKTNYDRMENGSNVSSLSPIWQALKGRAPALAPGALAQLGLLGLLFMYKHPNLERRPMT